MHFEPQLLTVLATVTVMATPAVGVKPMQDELKTANQ